MASLWIDYVPSESNPADVPSRLHELSPEEAVELLREMGDPMAMDVPDFTDESGEWLSSVDIASAVWGLSPR